MKKILLVDDHSVVRTGLKNLLSLEDDMMVADEAEDGVEALQKIRHGHFDIVIMDISMPRKNGVDTLHELRHFAPELPVLILSGHSEEKYALPMIRSGCRGYISKDSNPEEIITAIRTICAGNHYVSATLKELMIDKLTGPSDSMPHETLSEREFQVFYKLASGEKLTDIAEEMFISVKTVGTYRSRILEKMGMKSNSDLTLYSIKHELLM